MPKTCAKHCATGHSHESEILSERIPKRTKVFCGISFQFDSFQRVFVLTGLIRSEFRQNPLSILANRKKYNIYLALDRNRDGQGINIMAPLQLAADAYLS